MKISKQILKKIIKEELLKEVKIVKFNSNEMDTLHQNGEIYKDDIVYQFQDKVEEDKEGKMAQGQLNRTVELASMLKKEFDVNTDLPEWVESKITKAEDYLSTVFDYMRGKQGIGEDFGHAAKQMQGFSSKEAKKVMDDAIRNYAKDLRKVQYRVIKDWMSKAKSGVIDYFDVVRGIETGDASRAYPYETKFLMSMLNKDKIIDRFRKYFGGKKGKKRGIKR